MDDNPEKRNIDGRQRKARVALGGISAPIAILITSAITELWGKKLSQEIIIALSTLIGSLVSVMTICFWDLRGLVLAHLRRRVDDPKKRKSESVS